MRGRDVEEGVGKGEGGRKRQQVCVCVCQLSHLFLDSYWGKERREG